MSTIGRTMGILAIAGVAGLSGHAQAQPHWSGEGDGESWPQKEATVSATLDENPGELRGAEEGPPGLLLTWQQDPTTTMTIDWHTDPAHEGDTTVRYKEFDSDDWQYIEADSFVYAQSKHWSEEENKEVGQRTIHRVELTGLEPRTKYRFQVGEFERKYKFETVQEDIEDDPLIFGAGGDTDTGSVFRNLNRAAVEFGVQFIVLGGDFAYADGLAEHVDRWHQWFEDVRETLITEEGKVIPVVLSIGNHEMVNNDPYIRYDDYEQTDEWRSEHAPYFYSLFAFPGQPGYNVLDFNDYLSLVSLDSRHSNPIEGEQLAWLKSTLEGRADSFTHIIPFFHVPLYPSVRDFEGTLNTRLRDKWAPVFEEHGVRLVLEHHDHAHKRTKPIRAEQVHPEGIVYLGDGAWGRGPRSVNNADKWYMAEAQTQLHGWLVTLDGEDIYYEAFDENGNVFDEGAQVSGPPMDSTAWQIKPEHEHIHGPEDPNVRAWPFMLEEASKMGPHTPDEGYILLYDRGTRQSRLAHSTDLVNWEDLPQSPILDEVIEPWQGHRAWFRHILYDAENNRYLAVANGSNPEVGIRAVGLFESEDLESWAPLTDDEGESVNPIATVDSFEVSNGGRVYGVWLGRENETWYLLCQVEQTSHAHDYVVGVLTSEDLIEWEESSANPVFEPELDWEGNATRAQGVTEHEGTYWMIYAIQAGSYGFARSDDGIEGDWRRHDEPVLLREEMGGRPPLDMGNLEDFFAPTALLKTPKGWTIMAAGISGGGISRGWQQAEITLINAWDDTR